MVAVFVARDEGNEYPRYRKDFPADAAEFMWTGIGGGGVQGGSSNFNLSDLEKDVSNCDRELSREEIAKLRGTHFEKAKTNDTELSTISYLKRRIGPCNSDDYVVVVKSIPKKNELKEEFKDDAVRLFVEKLVGLARHVGGSALKEEDIYLFIHWGGGSPEKYEVEFLKALERTMHSDIHSFACSSRRRECFDVTSPVITLPKTQEDLKRIVSRFTFDRVKDVMTDYVCQAFSSSHPEYYKLNPREADSLRHYLNWMFDGELKRRFSQDEASWMMDVRKNNVMCQIMGDKMCTEVCFDNAVSALFTQLLREGVYHV